MINMILSIALMFAAQEPQPNFADYPAQDAISYDIKLEILANGQVEGSVEYHFIALEEITTLYLDRTASDKWQVEFTQLDGEKIVVGANAYQYQIPLPRSASPGDDIVFAASFKGWPADGLYRERNYLGDTYFFSDGFPSRTRAWLPCEDSNADRAQFSLD